MTTGESIALSECERRTCMLLVGRLQRDLLCLSTSELGDGPEALALDFAYAKVGQILSDALDRVISNEND